MRRLTLHAIAFREEGEWIAHCLELDIVSSGPTAHAALDSLVEALALQLSYARDNDNFEYLFRPAPESAWRKLAEIIKGPHQTVIRPIDDRDSEPSELLETQLAA
jgi:hypothetical protein